MKLSLKIPPPFVALCCVLLIYLLSKYFPLFYMEFSIKPYVIGVFIVTGLTMDLIGVFNFFKSRTTINPRHPEKTSELVTTGIYKFSRNPMYLGMLSILIGIVFYLGTLSGFFIIPLFILYINQYQIKPEERVLHKVYGEDYLHYTEKVRRWI